MQLINHLKSVATSNSFALFAVLLAFLLTVVEPAFAATTPDTTGAIGKSLCAAIKIAQGATGKAIAVIVVVSVAVGMFFGKVTWGLGVMVCVAMTLLFGAQPIVQMLTDSQDNICP